MGTKLPWYVLPVYPAFALAVGAYLAKVWDEGDFEMGRWRRARRSRRSDDPCPRPHRRRPIFALLAVAARVGCLYFGGVLGAENARPPGDLNLQVTCASVALTMTVTALLLVERDRQFLVILIWGMYLSLLLFVSSNHWVWELGEAYPVKPVASLIREHTPPEAEIYTSYPYSRPSLNFYSDRRIVPRDRPALRQKWQDLPPPYFLLDRTALETLNLDHLRHLGSAEGWVLVTRSAAAGAIEGIQRL
jgi:4-amino-4-deoxy-L-arabinose transferase-like glycosyltransferase